MTALDDLILRIRRDVAARGILIQEAIEDRELGLAHSAARDLELDSRDGRLGLADVFVCPTCQLECKWPGLLDHHRRIVHGEEGRR